jgi:hypothetical protein
VLEAVALPRRQAPNIRERRDPRWIVGILLVVPSQQFSDRHVPLDGTILEHWVWDREFVCDSPDSFSQLRVSNSYEALVTFPSGLRCRAYDFPFQFCLHESFIPSSDGRHRPACDKKNESGIFKSEIEKGRVRNAPNTAGQPLPVLGKRPGAILEKP